MTNTQPLKSWQVRYWEKVQHASQSAAAKSVRHLKQNHDVDYVVYQKPENKRYWYVKPAA
jgi:hypothetical protein